MTDFGIRLARREDALAFREVEEDAADLLREAPELSDLVLPPSESVKFYRDLIGRGRCLCAEPDGQVVGIAAAGPIRRVLHLYELSVRRSHQARGIGGRLLEALAIDARNGGFAAITLHTFREIAWNAPFYVRHGFEVLEEFAGREHLLKSLQHAEAGGLPMERRCAMIRHLG